MGRDSQEPDADDSILTRRRFVTVSGVVGTAVLAGCSSGGETDGTGDQTEGNGENGAATDTDDRTGASGDDAAGQFRLLISDQPVAIDEFDSLEVSFDRARVFRGDEQESEEADESETETGDEQETEAESEGEQESETERETETESEAETEDEAESEDEEEREDEQESEGEGEEESEGEQGSGEDGQRGFTVIDLGGATVDLTQVVGEKAISVFEGELSAGRYTKIELYAAEIGGIVDGESVDVKIPSGKLQIVKPFEVRAGETVSFVFDINVVKKGQSGEYNLLPVIAKSGVEGEDVDVEEVGDEGDDDEGNEDEGEDDDESDGEGAAGGEGGDGQDGA